jgi:hypothetical protein
MNTRVIAAVLGAAALAVPAAAAADSGHGRSHDKRTAEDVVKDNGKGKGKAKKAKKVMLVFKGSFTAPGTVDVRSGNAHVRKGGFVGEAVAFDFASAKVVVADTNADSKLDVADVKDGDLVLVQARLDKRAAHVAPAAGGTAEPIVARKLIDKTNAPLEDEEPAPTG